MNNINKFKYISFGLIIGLLISTITVYAVNISSSNVEYDNSNSGIQSNNVEGAINELYQGVNAKLPINTFGESIYGITRTVYSNYTQQLELTKGKYIVYASTSYGHRYSGRYDEVSDNDLDFSCVSSNCTINKIAGKNISFSGTQKWNNIYFYATNTYSIFYVEINNNDDTLELKFIPNNTINEIGIIHNITAIPINE